MGLVLFLFFSLLLPIAAPMEDTAPTSCSATQDDQYQSNSSSLHLTIHHVHGPCSPVASSPLPVSELLSRDENRVQALKNRLTKDQLSPTKSKSGDLQSKSIGIPLNPGLSIGVGNYVMKIGLGTPVKYYVVVVDTGSSFNWVQCKPCTVYCHSQVGPVFDPTTSNTYKHLSCDSSECSSLQEATLNAPACSMSNLCIYQASYGDRSYSVGYLSQDTLTLANAQTLPGFTYGCGQDNMGLFGRSAGIIGLARNELSLLSQLSPKYGYVFSYCLPTSSSTGTLSIGQSSYDPSLYKYTRMYTNPQEPTLYFIRLTSITVAGRALQVSTAAYTSTPTIIDSGTVITRLPQAVYTALQSAFSKAMSRYPRAPAYAILDTCFRPGGGALSVPEVRMIFEGGPELNLQARNLVIDVGDGVSCLAFAATEGISIIGNIQQQTVGVVYDVPNSRIGFAAGVCG